MDHEVVGGHRAHAGCAAGIACRKLVKGATKVEQITFSRDLADQSVIAESILHIASRHAPAAAVVLDVESGRLVERDRRRRHCGFPLEVRQRTLVGLFDELHVSVELIDAK